MAKTRSKGPQNLIRDEVPSMDNLSEEEMSHFRMARGATRGGSIRSSEGTVSQKAHDDEVGQLRERISGLEAKLEESKEELSKVREERDSYKGRFETKLEENKGLAEENESLKASKRQLLDRVSDLEGKLSRKAEEVEVVRDDAEIERLGKENDGLRSKLRESEAKREELEAEVAELNSKIESFESTEPEKSDEKTGDTIEAVGVVGRIRRTSPTTMESELFTGQKYRVMLARSGRTISFTPDVEGAAVCSDGRIELPKLAQLVPFSGEAEYETILKNGKEIVAFLQ